MTDDAYIARLPKKSALVSSSVNSGRARGMLLAAKSFYIGHVASDPYVHFCGLRNSKESYFNFYGKISLASFTGNNFRIVADVGVGYGNPNSKQCYIFDSSTGSTQKGVSLGYYVASGNLLKNNKLNGNSSASLYNPTGDYSITDSLKIIRIKLEIGVRSVGADCQVYYKVGDDEVLAGPVATSSSTNGLTVNSKIGWAMYAGTDYGIGHSSVFDLYSLEMYNRGSLHCSIEPAYDSVNEVPCLYDTVSAKYLRTENDIENPLELHGSPKWIK